MNSNLTVVVAEKIHEISEDVMKSLPMLDELSAILRQKAGLLDGGELSATDPMIAIATKAFQELAQRSLVEVYGMVGFCERVAEVVRTLSTIKGCGDRAQVLVKLSSSLSFAVGVMKQAKPDADNQSQLVATEVLELNTAFRLSRN
eukprot:6617438-Pyramimonas_sp.AAC.1